MLSISSSAFAANDFFPKKYTCDGEDVNPPLEITGVPTNARSLALIVDDPDAPGGTWTHWTAWNISPETHEIPERSIPSGAVEGMTSFGKPGYGGPCPPSGAHRYFFKLFALDTMLDLPAGATRRELEQAMRGYAIEQAELMGKYQRR